MIGLLILLGGVWLLALLGAPTIAKWILGLFLLNEIVNDPQLFTGTLNLVKRGT